MSIVVQVLEKMAQEANVDIEQLLTSAEINSEQSKAIINQDITSLERQLDICHDIVCMVVPAEDDENDTQEEEDKSTTEAIKTAIGF